MERCPIELWDRIVSLVCTDGGYTGCSLSLVSRRMRDTVKPVRFHSVSLVSADHLLTFAGLLESLKPSPVIHHLFISINDDTQVFGDDLPLERAEELNPAFQAIFTAASPSLETLVVHDSLSSLNLIRSGLAFPLLRDLSISHWCMRTDVGTSAYPRSPSLRRLHVTSSVYMRDYWNKLVQLASSITHLRLSGLYGEPTICPFLCVLLVLPAPTHIPGNDISPREIPSYEPDDEEAHYALTIASQLPNLTFIYIQPLELHNSGWIGVGPWRHDLMKVVLENIALTSTRGESVGGLFTLPASLAYLRDEARRHWLDLVEGGDGPWKEGPADFVLHSPRASQREQDYPDAAVGVGDAPWQEESVDYVLDGPDAEYLEPFDADGAPRESSLQNRLPMSPPTVSAA